jgi:hypothetical protein
MISFFSRILQCESHLWYHSCFQHNINILLTSTFQVKYIFLFYRVNRVFHIKPSSWLIPAYPQVFCNSVIPNSRHFVWSWQPPPQALMPRGKVTISRGPAESCKENEVMHALVLIRHSLRHNIRI